jgi:hypothetical protein
VRPTATTPIPRSRPAPPARRHTDRRPPLCPLPDYRAIFREPAYSDPDVSEWYRENWEEEQQRRAVRGRRPSS